MDFIKSAIFETLQEDHPMTVRQVFYQLTSKGVVPKTEASYKGPVIRLLSEMRRDGTLPWNWIADNTRWMRKPQTFKTMEAALRQTHDFYRRDLWDAQECSCEIWLEKDALAGVLYEVTRTWDVPLMVTRGYASLSFLYSSAREIQDRKKPAHLFYFGDYDPSGVDITRVTEARLREFAPDADISFHRVAVTPEQIQEYNLPTRPTKKSDSRSKGFSNESVEVDALPSRVLRSIAEECILKHIDQHALSALRAVEAAEKESLGSLLHML